MDRLSIPNSSVTISRLGFGCARIFGGSELRSGSKLIEAAINQGISHFDTAPAYGSEEVLGSVLAGLTDVTIATKIGIPRFSGEKSVARRIIGPLYRATLRPLLGRVPAIKSRLLKLASTAGSPHAPVAKRALHRGDVLRELDDSLRRLRRQTVDLYLLHEPEGIEITDELREVFLSLQKEGVIKAFGLAFGGIPDQSLSFGSAVQCRFQAGLAAIPHPNAAHIYHGVVRFGLQNERVLAGRSSAGSLIAERMADHPRAAVIFSASSRHQILEIAAACRQRG